jgi:hypothetical protein
MALMCFAGPCPTSFTSESLSFPNKLPFPELSGPEAQAACGGNPNVQSACVYGDARWLQNQGVEALLQMNQVNICDGTNGGWQFRMTDETLNCSQTAQICTVKRVYRTLNGFPPGECTLVPAPTI